MDNCWIIIFIAIIFLTLALLMQQSNNFDGENFYMESNALRKSPYYETTFQIYPGKYINFSSNRNSYCLQQHQNYSGYRNCMLYLQ